MFARFGIVVMIVLREDSNSNDGICKSFESRQRPGVSAAVADEEHAVPVPPPLQTVSLSARKCAKLVLFLEEVKVSGRYLSKMITVCPRVVSEIHSQRVRFVFLSRSKDPPC